MTQPQIYEGTGEELEPHLKQFPKRRFRLIALSDERATGDPGQSEQRITPNETGLVIMQELADRQKERCFTSDGSDTVKLLKEARSGAMYDRDPANE